MRLGHAAQAVAFVVLASAGPDEQRFAQMQSLADQRKFADLETLAAGRLTELEAADQGESLEAARVIDFLLRAKYNLEKADAGWIPLGERARDIKIRLDADDRADFAVSLNNLGNLRRMAGDLKGAYALYRQAYEVRVKTLPPDDPDIARSLSNLGNMSNMLGRYNDAITWQTKSLEILERKLGADHRDVGVAMYNLAGSLIKIGDYESTRRLHERLRARDEADPTRRGTTAAAGTIAALADDLFMLGDKAGGIELRKQAIEIFEAAYGVDSTMMVGAYRGLARLYYHSGDLRQARPLIDRASAIWDPGSGDTGYADTLFLQADVWSGLGDVRGAVPLYEKGLRIVQSASGSESHELVPGLVGLARARAGLGERDRAIDLALRAERLARIRFEDAASQLAPREALLYERVRSSGTDTALEVLANVARPTTSQLERVWDAIIRSRALVLQEVIERRRTQRTATGTAIEEKAEDLDAARNLLARAVGSAKATPQELAKLRDERDAAERALVALSGSYARTTAQRGIGFSEVRSALPRGTGLVAFVQYGDERRRSSRKASVRSFAAFVLVPGEAPRLVPLGPAGRIDALVEDWRRQAVAPPRGLGASLAVSQRAYEKAARALRVAIWDPLSPQISRLESVFIVPDGTLSLVNLATLPADDGRFLAEAAPTLHELCAERDLVRHDEAGATGERILVFGAPDFGASNRPRFRPLPSAAAEAREVAERPEHAGRATLRVGSSADESSFKRLAPGSRIVHLATHGFFTGRLQDVGRANPAWDEPLLQSGLALAGANAASTATGADDGVLLAEEVAACDLTSVDWAVLSACESGLGEVRAGEGVLGLRRAFEIAGARTVVMSLWAVEDEPTRAWMRALYDQRARGGSTAACVREANFAVLSERRARGVSVHPYYWGAFVASGDWR